MRKILRDELDPFKEAHSNIGLAYNAWAPVGTDGKVENTPKWLNKLESVVIDDSYEKAYYKIWKNSLETDSDSCQFEFTLSTRLLIGHGESSATDVGLKVHHTWGVPIIPGSALKGLLYHYLTITYPGQAIRAIFGAPEAPGEAVDDKACAGFVTFHDALYILNRDGKPFVADVLTVHQKDYYKSEGDKAPNDYGDPNPVSFLTVRPAAKFLVALSGPEKWRNFAMEHLQKALAEWGVGGKTSAGYGRGKTGLAKKPNSRIFEDYRKYIEGAGSQKDKNAGLQEWFERLQSLSEEEKSLAIKLTEKKLKGRLDFDLNSILGAGKESNA